MAAVQKTERRRNRPLRDQAQAWFDALKLRSAELEGAEVFAERLRGWNRPEDIMRDSPGSVPLFLDLVWRSRKLPGFSDLFRTESGEIADTTSEILALPQKCFDDIVIAHLLGTMRLTCEKRQNEWLSAERVRRRRGLAKAPFIGAMLRGLGLISPMKAEVLLAYYPQKGLYAALKPFLQRRAQFDVVEALAGLPTRIIGLLGPVPALLDSPEVIGALASLDVGRMKIAIEMAETYVQAEGSGTSDDDYAAPRYAALSALLTAGTPFFKVAEENRALARDAITKLVPHVKADFWRICGDLDAVLRVTECPDAVAAELKDLTAAVAQPVSVALSGLTDGRVAAHAIASLRAAVDPETFESWITDEMYLPAWRQLVHALNRIVTGGPADEIGPLLKGNIGTACERGLKVFAEIAAPLPKAA